MGNPIVIDDGGSTRVKKLDPAPGTGNMDPLLDVTDPIGPPAPPGAPGSKHLEPGPYSQIKIVYQDSKGDTFPIAAQPFNTFEVFSGINQRVKGEIVGAAAAGPLRLTIFGTGGVEPLVEARQRGARRRYVIANAGGIESVIVNGAAVFTAAAPPNPAAVPPIIYTSVVLT